MSALDLLEMLTKDAKKYRLGAIKSIDKNSHMHELQAWDHVDQLVVDAVLVDFINHIAARHCVDYALYTKDLEQP
jgi:hypothetical protein